VDTQKHYKYVKQSETSETYETIAIRDNWMQQVLDKNETGYTKTIFCKKLRMLERHLGIRIILPSKQHGYVFNDTGNARYYRFRNIDLYEIVGKED
jgi:hypothetical protein